MKEFFQTKKLILISGLTFLCLLIGYYIYFYSFSFPVNSDNVYFLHAAEDMLNGNPLLKNWNGGFFTALTGDILWAAFFRLFLSQKAVLYLIGPLSYALIVLFCFLILSRNQPHHRQKYIGFFLIPILFVPKALRHPLMTLGMHGIAILYILILTWLFGILAAENKSSLLMRTVYFFLLWMASIADGYVIYYFAIPALSVLILDAIQSRSKKNRILFFLTLFGTVAGVATIQLINRMGFLRTEKTAFELIKFSDWGKYICNTADTWFRIFGFSFHEFSIRKPDAIFEISGAVTALIVLILILKAIKDFFQQDMTTKVLIAGFLFCTGSFTFTAVTQAEPAVRYLSPAFFSGLLIAGKQILRMPPRRKSERWLLGIPLLLFALGNVSVTYYAAPVTSPSYVEIADALKDRGVKAIYATYWETHALSYYSGERIQAAPIMAENDKIIPYQWSSKTDWYEPNFNATAILISQNKRYGLSEDLLIRTFGEYRERFLLDETEIYIYGKNLSAIFANAE